MLDRVERSICQSIDIHHQFLGFKMVMSLVKQLALWPKISGVLLEM